MQLMIKEDKGIFFFTVFVNLIFKSLFVVYLYHLFIHINLSLLGV
jgi:hypothetical protein